MHKFSTLRKLAQAHGTPIYVYDLVALKKRVDFFLKHIPKRSHVHFALKANNNREVLQVLKFAEVGVDVVSGGEIDWALKAGFKPEQMVFSGIGKSKSEIEKAILAKVSQINIESLPELGRVAKIAEELDQPANIAFRMNPDVDARTHPYIRTGFRENKFGLDFTEMPLLIESLKAHSKWLRLTGLALHIGSQIREVRPFQDAILKTCELFKSMQAHGFKLSTLDIGGGLGIDYSTGLDSKDEELIINYFKVVSEVVDQFDIEKLFFEPGRILVARMGVLLSEIQYIKKTPFKNFMILNTGMHHLMRPALYQAEHRIEVLVEEVKDSSLLVFDVVGPICESSDVIGLARALPATAAEGDIVAIYDVGAYGAVMASDYNLHARAQEIAVEGLEP